MENNKKTQGPNRIQARRRSTIPSLAKQSFLKKAFPYLVAGGSTGIGIGAIMTDFLS